MEYRPLLLLLADYVKPLMRQWAVTQEANFTTQLCGGIRYFDMRIAIRTVENETQKRTPDKFYLVHGLYANSAVDELLEIRSFLYKHSKEVVIVDFQHFYGMSTAEIEEFEQIIKEIFGNMLIPYQKTISSLAEVWHRRQQVLAIGQRKNSLLGSHVWPRKIISQPWANTIDPQALAQFLDEYYRPGSREGNRFFVHQGILSTNIDHFLSNPDSTLKELAGEANKVVDKWLTYPPKVSGPGGVNIVITDFSIHNFPQFAQKVITINLMEAEEDDTFTFFYGVAWLFNFFLH
ncbi:unnamed protein product [Schistocephalus solidus]|uniref:PI-PLC X domain-containing protein 3 n=1 Tax=Schistocephalus solidus TaxID=70667 RepID=A0A183TJ41_SCHSO|nr:unnamed protein product [Schistocephalus solidus]